MDSFLIFSGLNFKFNGVIYRGNSLIVRDVTAEGAISSTGGKVS